jgi:hypothetical protein
MYDLRSNLRFRDGGEIFFPHLSAFPHFLKLLPDSLFEHRIFTTAALAAVLL